MVFPLQCARFLDIEIDTVAMELRLPYDKICKLKVYLLPYLTKRKVTGRDLERLAGRLVHCCTVVKGGRSFYTMIYDAIRALKKPYYLFSINAVFHEEISWWLNFIDTFNGKAKMLGRHTPFESVHTDASNWGLI